MMSVELKSGLAAKNKRAARDLRNAHKCICFQVRALFTEHKVSTILVLGGSGDYFEVADTVVMMDCFVPKYVCVHCVCAA